MKKIALLSTLIFLLVSISFTASGDRAFTYREGVLDNGLKFFVIERSELPLVSFGMMVKSGAYHEKKPGIASLLSSTLIYGNNYMSPQDVVSTLDSLGASVSVSADYDSMELGSSMLSSTAERVIKIISRIVRLPRFHQGIVDRFKMRTLAAIKAQKDSIADEARMIFYRSIYGEHPYARNILGTETSVSSITRNDLIDFHRTHFVPNNTVIAIVGNIRYERAKQILNKYFSDWKKRSLPAEKNYTIPPKKQKVVLVNYPTTQGFIRLGHISARRNNPMYYHTLIYNAILGGSGFGSRLTDTIREKLGLTYGIVSYFYVYRKQEGYFHINFSTNLDKIKFAVQKVYEVLEKYLKEGPIAQELEGIKKYLMGMLIMQRETPSQLISLLMNQELYGLKPYYWEQELITIKNLTLEQVKKAAKYIYKNQFSVVVVADKSKVNITESDLLPITR